MNESTDVVSIPFRFSEVTPGRAQVGEFYWNTASGKVYVCKTANVWTEFGAGSTSGASGSASLNFGNILDGQILALTFTLTGAVVGDKLAPAWPSTLDAGLIGTMHVIAANTVEVRLANLSGGAIDPAAMTFGAQVIT